MAAAPSEDVRAHLGRLIAEALHVLAPGHGGIAVVLEHPKLAVHGDYACNVALQLAKTLKRAPREVAACNQRR
jgi:arginyl-tRNA synthetase